jgi:hypothetical protein
VGLTLTRISISFCCVTISFVLPQSQLPVSLIISNCCNGKYGWKKLSFPNTSSGNPINTIMLLWSLVFKLVGLVSVGALAASGGDPQSSNVWRSPGRRETREY